MLMFEKYEWKGFQMLLYSLTSFLKSENFFLWRHGCVLLLSLYLNTDLTLTPSWCCNHHAVFWRIWYIALRPSFVSHETTETFSSCSRSFLSAVWQTPGGLLSTLYLGVAPSTHSSIRPTLAQFCRDSFASGRLSYFNRWTPDQKAIDFLVTLAYSVILARRPTVEPWWFQTFSILTS